MRSWIDYSGEVAWDPSLSLVTRLVEAGQPFWLDIENPTGQVVDQLATLLGLHPLAVEDSLLLHHRISGHVAPRAQPRP